MKNKRLLSKDTYITNTQKILINFSFDYFRELKIKK